ncbi:unnamed protein product [Cuscuta europaea]|uniref:BED-type domain-containing protein n=1 Tax=Cuscuta europaea TaxID=41803 RepID=A0A9P0YWJ8_CUSEU|nr:unnamed protein product [Cuscuta europaea]
MERGRHSVNMGNLQRNRKREIATTRSTSRKGKGKARVESSFQSRDDFETDYQRRDDMMMSDEQLQNLLSQNDPRFAQEQQFPTTIDEEELEDDDVEEDAGGDGTHDTPDDEQELEDEGRSTTTTQIGKKSKSPIVENNYTKRKDKNTEKWYASCNHCNKEFSLGTSGGYESLKRHLQSAHFVEYAKIDKGKGKQTQILRLYSKFVCTRWLSGIRKCFGGSEGGN